MKEMNMNAVRMSHYPPDARFLELCDELGLYVLDELAGWQKHYSVEAGRPLVAEMLQRDVNHPSILFWDNGNEGGWETGLDGDFAKWDPQHRQVLRPWDVIQGINTSHYRNYEQTVIMAKGGFVGPRKGKDPQPEAEPFIYMPTEFLHALYDGGAGAGLEDYWNAMRNSPVAGGGFIWALMDEGVKRPDTGKIDVQGNQAPDGILGPYREKEASFYTIKELWSPIVIKERALQADFNGTLSLENRFGFTDASACRFKWQLLRMPVPGEKSFKPVVVIEGVATAPSIAPGQKGMLKLDLPATWRVADMLSLRIEDPQGREVLTTTWSLPGMARFDSLPEQITSTTKAVLSATDVVIKVVVGALHVEFSKTTGYLQHVLLGGSSVSLANGPRLAVGEAKLETLEARIDGSDAIVTGTYSGALKSVVWRVRANGWLDCEYAYTAEKPSPYLGVCFDYPEALVKAKRWVGEGPYRTWQNRRRGMTLGAWSNDYNDTITGYSGWVYPEFKGCFAGVRWLTLDTREGVITTVVSSDNLYVQVLTPSFPTKEEQKASAIELPQAGLAFLHEIPAVGEKFHPAETHGPQSQLRPVRELYRGKVSFCFGK
jgi:Glycosyl hydrolases family 2, TIM barrel domain/Beta galactosidase small chain